MCQSDLFDTSKRGVARCQAHTQWQKTAHQVNNLNSISVATAISLTGWSESTMRRRIADGVVTRRLEAGENGRSMMDLESIMPHLDLPLENGDVELILAADGGVAEAQTDLALKFLLNNNAKGALYWLELSVKQDYANAMYYLGRCYIEGAGVARDENVGLIWLLKAAVGGHVIARAQMQQVKERLVGVRQ